jgi:hypothetical protein
MDATSLTQDKLATFVNIPTTHYVSNVYLGESQQLHVYCNFEGSHSIGNNDSTPSIWMHHYSNSRTLPIIDQYMISVGSFLDYSCPYFKEMLTKSLGKQCQWANYKHLYFIFTVICNLYCEVDVFMHAPSFSFKEVKRVLENGVLNHCPKSWTQICRGDIIV